MKFGRQDNIDYIDFTLPDEPIENQFINFERSKNTHLYLGATGWSMPEWKGIIYPKPAHSGDFLKYYSRCFNSIELNSTHYRLPNSEMIKKWKSSVPIDFKFCPKIWQNISHRKNLGKGTAFIEEFTDKMLLFEENLGPCFLQLPPYFDFDRIDQLAECIKSFPKSLEIAVEARHQSFFSIKNQENFFKILTDLEVMAVITDVAGRRDVIHSRLTYPKAFIRWVGNALHNSDYTRLEEWKKRILKWSEYGISEVYFFPHQPDNLLTPQISSYFYRQFDGKENILGRAPQIIINHDQLKLF